MTIGEVSALLGAEVHCGGDRLDAVVHSACGADLMSDVLANVKDHAVLLTGLLNPHVVRTAQMLDVALIVFVRGKVPTQEILDMAQECGIAVMNARQTLFEACGILYQHGLRGGGTCDAR